LVLGLRLCRECARCLRRPPVGGTLKRDDVVGSRLSPADHARSAAVGAVLLVVQHAGDAALLVGEALGAVGSAIGTAALAALDGAANATVVVRPVDAGEAVGARGSWNDASAKKREGEQPLWGGEG